MKILLISTCKEKLHELEFVKPIEDILKKSNVSYFIKHYKNIRKGDLRNSKKVIICGTSLQDNEYIKDPDYFLWIPEYNKPILGICAGMQVISLVFELERQVKKLDIRKTNQIIKNNSEIGFYEENFKKEFLSLKGKQQVYHLHNSYAKISEEFKKHTNSKIPQAIKHKEKEIYGTLFHPEVRQKKLIETFCKMMD